MTMVIPASDEPSPALVVAGALAAGAVRSGFIASAAAVLVLSACGQPPPRQGTVAVETGGSTVVVPAGTPVITPGPAIGPGTQVVLVTPGIPAAAAGNPVFTPAPPVSVPRSPAPVMATPVSTAGMPLSGPDIVSLLSNQTVYARYAINTGTLRAGDPWVEYYRPDGQYYYRDQRRSFVGRWSVANGKLCYSENAATACGVVYRTGETISFTQEGKVIGNSTRVVPGDAERLAGGFSRF
ncbi:hypothetical protein [Inquilinus limosus]|uniref:Uncharacterized protein n=1 Tax=Inquilinus limosus TaxID=171674 RepID=A0A211ZEJ6_9PROT|nr:hypothetical protein [Inquilinus limosus]OWJ63584.1 hypothetical protein BWR60_29005 [Inquilinus limosus]